MRPAASTYWVTAVELPHSTDKANVGSHMNSKLGKKLRESTGWRSVDRSKQFHKCLLVRRTQPLGKLNPIKVNDEILIVQHILLCYV